MFKTLTTIATLGVGVLLYPGTDLHAADRMPSPFEVGASAAAIESCEVMQKLLAEGSETLRFGVKTLIAMHEGKPEFAQGFAAWPHLEKSAGHNEACNAFTAEVAAASAGANN